MLFFFFQAEDGIRDAQESRGLGDVYKRQRLSNPEITEHGDYVSCKWLGRIARICALNAIDKQNIGRFNITMYNPTPMGIVQSLSLIHI